MWSDVIYPVHLEYFLFIGSWLWKQKHIFSFWHWASLARLCYICLYPTMIKFIYNKQLSEEKYCHPLWLIFSWKLFILWIRTRNTNKTGAGATLRRKIFQFLFLFFFFAVLHKLLLHICNISSQQLLLWLLNCLSENKNRWQKEYRMLSKIWVEYQVWEYK